jgi:hypothetical protein
MGNTQWVQISAYSVMYSANTYQPRIGLSDAAGNAVGQLVFYPDTEKLPDDRLVSGGIPDLFYHLKDFKNVLDLLRNEKPMWLYYNASMIVTAENGIATEVAEPVGEGET